MEEDGRQDTWAEWKSAVIALSDDALHQYLEGVEGYTNDQVAEFVARDSAVVPEDWTTTDAAHEALTRFFAFKKDVLDHGGPGPALESQEAREAELSPSDVRGRTRLETEDRIAMMPDENERPLVHPPHAKDRSGSDYDDDVSDDRAPDVVESNASNYGAASVNPPSDSPEADDKTPS